MVAFPGLSDLLEFDKPCHRTVSSDRTASCDVCNMRGYISFLPSKMIISVGKLHRISVDPVSLKKEMSPNKNINIKHLLKSQTVLFPIEKFALIRKSKYGQRFCSGLRHTSEAYCLFVNCVFQFDLFFSLLCLCLLTSSSPVISIVPYLDFDPISPISAFVFLILGFSLFSRFPVYDLGPNSGTCGYPLYLCLIGLILC